ncbi:flavin reductase family protein [Actinokineospora sp. UTMC 2448]|uniref:flavin reductase family protein n=1 Tax=Actinokineospora sp. UTMC 2448 TaxID=2268449 RepID=UPI002164C968|nr:flavin reductase family protein [Actinokineospora sp. UTMC 2448]UVS79491.1 FMN reductase (NADH) RutF [Actinokineospora sp. UTMC 2448]
MTDVSPRLESQDEARAFREAMARVPTLVSVVTTDGREGPVGCTANAVMSLSTRPPSLVVSLACDGSTATAAIEAGRFAVNVLGWNQRLLIDRFARGPHSSRFAGVRLRRSHGVSVLDRSAVTITCDLDRSVPLLDHLLLVGTVTSTIGEESAESLVFCHRKPYQLAE